MDDKKFTSGSLRNDRLFGPLLKVGVWFSLAVGYHERLTSGEVTYTQDTFPRSCGK